MDILDSDDNNKLTNKITGEECLRDIVQFVQYEKYRKDRKLLIEEILSEIPKQFLEYMNWKGIKPKKQEQEDILKKINQIKDQADGGSIDEMPEKEYQDMELFDKLKFDFMTELLNVGIRKSDIDLVLYNGIYAPDIKLVCQLISHEKERLKRESKEMKLNMQDRYG